MLQRVVEWLLDLEDIRLGRDAPLLLQWEGRLQAWVLFCFALVALGSIVMAYRREGSSIVRRSVLAIVRCGLVALAVAVLAKPVLVLQRNRIEPSYVAFMFDTSLSMNNKDFAETGSTPDAVAKTSPPRLESVKTALAKPHSGPFKRLLERNGVQLSTFSSGVETLAFAESEAEAGALAAAVDDIQADGPSTDVAGAVRAILEQSQGKRLAAIVLASDGQSTQTANTRDVIEEAMGRQIPIYALRIGSPVRPADIEVGSLRAADRVFVKDLLAVEAQVNGKTLNKPTAVKLSLIDERSGATLATQKVDLAPDQTPTTVELRTKAAEAGQARFRVEAEGLPGEFNLENNLDRVDVTIVDDRLRLLYVDGYPRYEYRYLKNALLREQTVQLSVLLLEADENFVQEGTEPIRRFPETPEELNRFDVVMFGDVDPRSGWLSAAQMNMILDFVGNEGGGFALIAGERWAPRRFLGTPLEKLIPVSIDPQFLGRYETALTSGFRPALTQEGRGSRLFRFAADRKDSERIWESLPELFWVSRSLGAKPGASVLLEHPTLQATTSAMPVAVLGRYGAGKVYFQATDDTWRWRRHTGELLHDGYWLQVARELMRSSRVAQDRRYVLRSDRRTYEYGSPVRIQIEINDSALLAEQDASVEVTVRRADDASSPTVKQAEQSQRVISKIAAHRLSPDSSIFEATFVAPAEGAFVFSADSLAPRGGEKHSTAWVRIQPPDLEWRRPEADHETLERMAAATGGKVIELADVEAEFSAIRDRRVQIPDDVIEPLWDSKAALMLFVGLITMEWVLRKLFGLV